MLIDRLRRNEMFYKIAHINMCKDKEKLYKEIYKIKNPNINDNRGFSPVMSALHSNL